MTGWIVRPEQPQDEVAIRELTATAFADHPHSEGTEPAIVDKLREDGDLALSLVAEGPGGAILGHVAYSRAIVSSGEEGWFVLGPISVHPERQREGIGRALVEAGSVRLRVAGARGIMLLGDPALYARFGFRRDTPLHITGALAEYFQVLPFVDDVPDASVAFAPAFSQARLRNR